jgi:hypothetical protein
MRLHCSSIEPQPGPAGAEIVIVELGLGLRHQHGASTEENGVTSPCGPTSHMRMARDTCSAGLALSI